MDNSQMLKGMDMTDPQLRKKIINTISRFEAKCDKLSVENDVLRSSLAEFGMLSSGRSPVLDAHITQLQSDLKELTEKQSIQKRVTAIIHEIRDMLDQSKSQPRADEQVNGHIAISSGETPETITQEVNQSLNALLDHLPVPDELYTRLNQLKATLQQRLDKEMLIDLLNKLTDLVSEAFDLEQSRFKVFLQELTSQLVDFDHYLQQNSVSNQQANFEGEMLQQGIDSNLQEMKEHIDSSKTIEELSQKLAQNLANIGNRIHEYRTKEKQRLTDYDKQISSLHERLEVSEKRVNEIKRMLSVQKLRANVDSLTGLPNRASFDEQIQISYDRWLRCQGELCLAIADIDHFKVINDNFGHLAGDKVLKKIAAIFKQSIRTVDYLARYGGEEFLFIFERTSLDAAKTVLESLRIAVEDCEFCYRDSLVKVTVSFGLTSIRPDEDIESLFNRADEAMYTAKRAGRNRVECL